MVGRRMDPLTEHREVEKRACGDIGISVPLCACTVYVGGQQSINNRTQGFCY